MSLLMHDDDVEPGVRCTVLGTYGKEKVLLPATIVEVKRARRPIFVDGVNLHIVEAVTARIEAGRQMAGRVDVYAAQYFVSFPRERRLYWNVVTKATHRLVTSLTEWEAWQYGGRSAIADQERSAALTNGKRTLDIGSAVGWEAAAAGLV